MRLILFILISLLPGCTMQYSYELFEVYDINIKKPSSFVEISAQTVQPSVIVIKTENKTDDAVFIDWNQSSINGSPIYSGSLVAGTLRPESGTMPPTVIPENDYSVNIVLPMINVKESSVIETFTGGYTYTQVGTKTTTNANVNSYGGTVYGRSSSSANTSSNTYGYSFSSSTIKEVKDILPMQYPARITLKISQKDKDEFSIIDVIAETKKVLVCYDGKENYDKFLKGLSEIKKNPRVSNLRESTDRCKRIKNSQRRKR